VSLRTQRKKCLAEVCRQGDHPRMLRIWLCSRVWNHTTACWIRFTAPKRKVHLPFREEHIAVAEACQFCPNQLACATGNRQDADLTEIVRRVQAQKSLG